MLCVQNVEEAASILHHSDIIAYPTETFFAVGGLAHDPRAVQAVYAAKMRPQHMALPVIIGNIAQLNEISAFPNTPQGAVWRHTVFSLAEQFWPAPLSILVPAAAHLPSMLTGGTGLVAVRLSPHPAAQALCNACQAALISTSANVSGETAVTRAAELSTKLCAHIAAIFDAAPTPLGGKASTLVQITNESKLQVLRRGAVSEEALHGAGYTLCPSTL